MNQKICAMVSERIIESLDKGVIPWRKPWVGGLHLATSYVNQKPYSFLNQCLLEDPGEYITYKQAEAAGGHVKKGAKSHKVVFWSMLKYDEDGKLLKGAKESEEKVDRLIPYLKYWNVFHINDCEGIEPHKKEELPGGAEENRDAEQVITDYQTREKLTMKRDKISARACYNLFTDTITIPLMEQFEETAEYYSTIFHELVHSTGAKNRLNRFADNFSAQTSFGSKTYSKEELVAEMGAAFLVSYFGLETDGSFQNSTAYIKNWRDRIAEDNSLIITAAGRAEKAFNYILNGSGHTA